MSTSLTIQSLRISAIRAAAANRTLAAPLPIRLGQKLAGLRRRRAERHMVLALHHLGHPGVIADFQRATRN
jgi:hypothetical protein